MECGYDCPEDVVSKVKTKEYITDKGRQKASVMTQDICLFTGVRKN